MHGMLFFVISAGCEPGEFDLVSPHFQSPGAKLKVLVVVICAAPHLLCAEILGYDGVGSPVFIVHQLLFA